MGNKTSFLRLGHIFVISIPSFFKSTNSYAHSFSANNSTFTFQKKVFSLLKLWTEKQILLNPIYVLMELFPLLMQHYRIEH